MLRGWVCISYVVVFHIEKCGDLWGYSFSHTHMLLDLPSYRSVLCVFMMGFIRSAVYKSEKKSGDPKTLNLCIIYLNLLVDEKKNT